MLFAAAAAQPDWEVTGKGHGRIEQRQVWVSGEPAGYADFPGLSSVIMVKKQVSRPGSPPVDSVQYAVSSRPDLAPAEALTLVRGHWSIENSLFPVKDDSFGEDRHVQHNHRLGAVISLFRNLAVALLRTTCALWAPKEPRTGRAQRLAAYPTAAVPLVS